MEESGNMDDHLTNLTDLFQKLTDLGEELSNSSIVGIILSSLPRSYDTLVTVLETRPEADLTLSLVQSKLLAEYNRRKEVDGIGGGEAVLKTTDRNTTCFFCKKNGHMKRNCMRYKT
ncbi:gag polyprotein [Lasius niger]|uniref:Gag polyprotein n=1 Tax=Lasius niger TaxID=67767 RepID=A0A0J7KSQ7_LASNI|nr:gag polyprotein [Lasius niger]